MTRTRTCGALIALTLVTWTVNGLAQNAKPFVPVTDEMLWKPNPADWLTWRRTLDSWGFSPLNQINKSNVAQMKMMWTRGMGPGDVQEATPLIYDASCISPTRTISFKHSTRRPAISSGSIRENYLQTSASTSPCSP